jgi:hypothetical protein
VEKFAGKLMAAESWDERWKQREAELWKLTVKGKVTGSGVSK